MDSAPALSVILISPGPADAWRCILHYIKGQTAAKQMELIIMAAPAVIPHLQETEAPLLGRLFARVQIIPLKDIATIGVIRAAAVAAATGDIVVFQEDHCFPASDWAEKLIEGFRLYGPILGPCMHNANPETLTSKVQFCITYGQWGAFATDGPKNDLPGHNSCYEHALLLSLGDRLPGLLNDDSRLHQTLRNSGHEFYFHSPARVYHVNISSLKAILAEALALPTLHAASWREQKSVLQRVSFSCLNLIMPLRQVRWFWQNMSHNQLSRKEKLCALPLCIAVAALSGIGTFYGVWFSSAFASRVMFRAEYQRESFLCTADRRRYTVDDHWNPAAWENIIP